MNRRTPQLLRREKEKATRAESVRMSKDEKLSLLSEIERIANSQHMALMQKIQRLREAIVSDN